MKTRPSLANPTKIETDCSPDFNTVIPIQTKEILKKLSELETLQRQSRFLFKEIKIWTSPKIR